MSRHDRRQSFLPGFEPHGPPARLDDPHTLTHVEQTVEQITSYIDVLRPRKKAGAPIDQSDIARCRREIERALEALRLPLPTEAWLDEFIIELAGWWFEFELAPDVTPPAIAVLPDQPRKKPSAPAYDGPVVGWDHWNDDD
jgi:hypothetical protein